MKHLSIIESSPERDRQNLLKELRSQIAKDFQIPLTSVPQSQMLNWLEAWLDKYLDQLDLAQILYRVDLEEKSYENTEILAQAIMEREAQKVIFRSQYGKKY